VSSTDPGQVAQEKNGEQVPSSWWSSWFDAAADLSEQHSSTPQHGIKVPAAVIRKKNIASHFFIGQQI
jgi:hypothetical protein